MDIVFNPVPLPLLFCVHRGSAIFLVPAGEANRDERMLPMWPKPGAVQVGDGVADFDVQLQQRAAAQERDGSLLHPRARATTDSQ